MANIHELGGVPKKRHKRQRSEMTPEQQLAIPEGSLEEASWFGFADPGEATGGRVMASSLPTLGSGNGGSTTRNGITTTPGRKAADSIDYSIMNKPKQIESDFVYIGKGWNRDPEMISKQERTRRTQSRLNKLRMPGPNRAE